MQCCQKIVCKTSIDQSPWTKSTSIAHRCPFLGSQKWARKPISISDHPRLIQILSGRFFFFLFFFLGLHCARQHFHFPPTNPQPQQTTAHHSSSAPPPRAKQGKEGRKEASGGAGIEGRGLAQVKRERTRKRVWEMSYRVQRSRAHYGRSPSPATRTLKSQEEAIDALSKENFDLKMRLQELQDHVAGSGGRRGDGAARHLTTRDGMRETAALKEHLAQMEREIEEKNRLLREVRNRQHDHVSSSSQGRRGFYRKEQGGKCFHDAACARIPTQTMFSHTHTHSHSHSHTHTHSHSQ